MTAFLKNQPKTLPSVSVSLETVLNRLIRAAVGEVVTYDELSACYGADIRQKGAGTLQRALRLALSEYNMVFEAVRSVGYKRLKDDEMIDAGKSHIQRARRACRRGKAKLDCVADFEKLTKEQQQEYNLRLSQIGIIDHVTDGRRAPALMNKVMNANATVPPLAAMECFKGS